MMKWLVGLMATAFMIAVAAAAGVVVSGSEIRVIDGDTVRLKGQETSIRIVGINAGETATDRAMCPAEIAAGKLATTRLRELLSAGPVSVVLVQCSCRPGTHGTKACNYGRSCGKLSVNGADVADTLIRDGLAARYSCGETSCPPPPRPWCS